MTGFVGWLVQVLTVAWAVSLLASCGPKANQPSDGRAGSIGTHSERLIDPVENPKGISYSGWVQVGVQPLGAVPYDQMTLPLVSPDGRWLAVQAGIAPRWATILAESGASLPMVTRLEIYSIDRREGVAASELSPPRLAAQIGEIALLGRSCDDEGFLIESPREDGSRWIGKVSWHDASVRWLVDGSDVNAFAALGPKGQLAWSRRANGAGHFDLVVRTSTGEWVLPSQGDDWVMPQWSGHGDGLFVFHLSDKRLQLRFAPATSANQFLTAMHTLPIVNDGQIFHAYQALITQSGVATEMARDQVAYFHPGIKRVAIWRPIAPSGQRNLSLNDGSLSGLVENGDAAIVTMQGGLVRLNVRDAQITMDLVSGTQIPRATPSSNWQFVLLSPDEDRIKLMAMKLIPVDRATAALPSR